VQGERLDHAHDARGVHVWFATVEERPSLIVGVVRDEEHGTAFDHRTDGSGRCVRP